MTSLALSTPASRDEGATGFVSAGGPTGHFGPAVPILCRRAAVVTGVAGFIGSHLAESLLALGWSVLGVDRRAPASDRVAAVNLAELTGQPGFSLRLADLCHAELGPLVSGSDVVFHLAGLGGVRGSWGPRFADYLACNVLATHRLLAACEAAGIPRVVVASSSSVYGENPGRPSRELDSTRPASPYGVSKLAAERLSLAYAARPGTDLSVVALRYFSVYGPRQRADLVLDRLLRAVLTGVPVQLLGDGSQRRQFTYVGDAVAATVAAALSAPGAEVINVAGPRSTSLRRAISVVEQVTGRWVPLVHGRGGAGEVHSTEADLTHARATLGYAPAIELDEGIGRQWAWTTSDVARLRAYPLGGS